ncbi:MAG: hypothetical protein LE169_05510 [Endomicrobium sp.]|nr:hypothetical protein [Endomicrobium sp.]
MKKIICICICICSSFGCGRLQSGGNAEKFDDTSGVGKHTPLSSDPANLPVPTTSPIPNPTAYANPDLNSVDEELFGKNINSYITHSTLSFFVNAMLVIFAADFPSLYFLRILRMVSVFSFPVHVALTNPSFLSQSKLSLTALAADTCLSLFGLITKNPSVISRICNIQVALEIFRLVTYPHVLLACSYIYQDLKSLI